MNRYLPFSLAISMTLSALAIPLRAATKPRAGTDSQNSKVWTNDDTRRLHDLEPISIVGRTKEDTQNPAPLPAPYLETQDPAWYAEQAAKLREELDRRRARLAGYLRAIEDVKSLKTMTGGIDLAEDDIGITPEAGIEILERRGGKES